MGTNASTSFFMNVAVLVLRFVVLETFVLFYLRAEPGREAAFFWMIMGC